MSRGLVKELRPGIPVDSLRHFSLPQHVRVRVDEFVNSLAEKKEGASRTDTGESLLALEVAERDKYFGNSQSSVYLSVIRDGTHPRLIYYRHDAPQHLTKCKSASSRRRRLA